VLVQVAIANERLMRQISSATNRTLLVT
jgi:hypothetical protein